MHKQALTIPAAALQRGPDGMFAYVVRPELHGSRPQPGHGDAAGRETRSIVDAGACGRRARGDQQLLPAAARRARARATAPRNSPRRHPPMSISRPSSSGPIATSLLMAGLLLVGSSPFRCCRSHRCRRSTSRPSMVTAQLPGASPETMASAVATPLEYQFAQIPGVAQMTSSSVLGHHADHACSSTSTATSTPRRRTSSRRSTPPPASCRRTCQRRPPTARYNPADSPILIYAVHSDVLPLTDRGRLRRERPRAADLAALPGVGAGRRSAASRSRPCASRSIRRRSPRWACSSRTWPASSPTATVDSAQGRHQRRAAQLRDLRQ